LIPPPNAGQGAGEAEPSWNEHVGDDVAHHRVGFVTERLDLGQVGLAATFQSAIENTTMRWTIAWRSRVLGWMMLGDGFCVISLGTTPVWGSQGGSA